MIEKQKNLIKQQLQYIGEDPEREGLIDTPKRIVKMWDEIYAGYKKNPADIFTTFKTDGYDQIVLLKNVEFYSMCEHHNLPFFGKAHIAYIPREKVVGISKLARLLEIYTKRMQIQERIGEQVTSDIIKYLDARGAACILEAQHLCMKMRGVKNPTSVMETSSLKGVFLTDASARMELMQLIRG
jgi:GTP cyclohydrolase IA